MLRTDAPIAYFLAKRERQSLLWRGSNQGNSFSGVGGYKKVWAVLKPVGSSGILAVPKLPLDSDSDDIIPIPAVL